MGPIVIPEILLLNLIKAGLGYLKADAQNTSTPADETFLGRILKGVVDGKHDYFIEAKELFGRELDNPRAIRTRLFFDASEANIPTIHVTMPQEMNSEALNSIGVGEHPDDTYFNNKDGTFTPNRQRYFDATYHVIITSDNHRELLIIYHAVKSMLISMLAEINLVGLVNPQLSGQDIRPTAEIVPEHIYMRGVGVSCSYETNVPRFFSEDQIKKIIINPGTPIDPNKQDLGITGSADLV